MAAGTLIKHFSNHKRRFVVLIIFLAILFIGWYFGQRAANYASSEALLNDKPLMRMMILTVAGLYIVTSAIPFVPGAEIGFGMLMIFGSSAAILVYLCMVAALLIAYLIGRFVPAALVAQAFAYLGFERAQTLVLKLAGLDHKERLSYLAENAPNRIIPFLLKHRYLALIAVLNLPGNVVLGGGGGIAFAAGMSGLYPLPAFVVSLLIAVAPVPLMFVLSHNFF